VKFNHYFANHFRDCRLLVTGFDPHRQREMRVHLIPGEFDYVGVTDGVDAWIAPSSVAPSDLFEKVRAALADIRAGREPKPAGSTRRRVLIDDDPQPSPTGRLVQPHTPVHQNLPINTPEAKRIRRAIHADL
jgi:hypothetical protein